MKPRNIYSLLLASLLWVACTDVEDVPALYPERYITGELFIVDKNATNETKALYSNLWAIQSEGFMFGHHDDLWYGRNWYNQSGRSDTKDVCGDYPAVFSFDLATVMDERSQEEQYQRENEIRKRVVIEAYNRGEVLTACCHLNNPLTGSDSWDNSSDEVLKEILTDGSEVNVRFKTWLDRLALFAGELKGANGELIPVLFRPFHEHTQSWPWWGSNCATQEEFIALWKFTVEYLRDVKGVHQLLYAISPQMDTANNRDNFLYRWPGNEYVDFLGMDCYHGLNPTIFTTNLNVLSNLSKELGKPCGVTETGVEGIQRDGVPEKNYWTQQILTPATGQFISMIVMWRNEYDPGNSGSHFYSVYDGHTSASNFLKLYQSPVSFFSADIPNMYVMAEGITVK
ncbi:MAG: glycoside hydrolase family 26 protein [Tannerellaceae bacterium]|nr:glycoside hydrolase family 26 protein [Tannerellaceae bacterium]